MLVPFILVLSAAIWDLRVYTAYRTDVAREMYVVADLIANGGGWASTTSVENVIEAAAGRLGEKSAGWLDVAVVTRGTARHDGSPCVDADAWCAPMASRGFYHDANAKYAFLNSDGNSGDCRSIPRSLPDEGSRFDADATVLPFENADPDGPGPDVAPPVEEWLSRNMRQEEWWVVVDSCSHFGEGPQSRLIGGRFMHLALGALDVSPVLRRRSAWASVDDLSDCLWC